MSFSNSGADTLALPSPTHAHQIDVTSAVRSLRRSISRSPSKFLSRTSSQSSHSSYHAASPQSPKSFNSTLNHHNGLLPSQPYPQSAPPKVASVHATPPRNNSTFTPLRSSIKLSLRSAKAHRASATSTPSRNSTRPRASPQSPFKRALISNPDLGNSVPFSTTPTGPGPMGQENQSPTLRKSTGNTSRHSLHLDVSGVSRLAFLKALDSHNDQPTSASSGTLKRSDATMNLDQQNHGSPVAKRRSLHGVSSLGQAEDQNLFGSMATPTEGFDIHEDASSEQEPSYVYGSTAREGGLTHSSSMNLNNFAKRTPSLRKSTLQQRYGEKNSLSRRTGERQLAQMSHDASTPIRSRPRLSSDQFLPPAVPRDSPFSAAGPLPNPSIHPLEQKSQPHPLSKTLSTSTSGGSVSEEPETEPLRGVERQKHPFSQSLPLNATRPTAHPTHDHTKVVATPGQSEQLWIPAFRSTGLVSKVNRNLGEPSQKMAPPDTPCKKPGNPFATFPPPFESALKKKPANRNSFAGTPSTPSDLDSEHPPDTFGNVGKGMSIFQRASASRSSRRGSMLMTEGEDRKLFGERSDIAPLDGEIPPTPTKSFLPTSLSNLSEQSLESPSTHRAAELPASTARPKLTRESTSKSTDDLSVKSEGTNEQADQIASSFGELGNKKATTPRVSSLSRSRAGRGFNLPSLLKIHATHSPTHPTLKKTFAKTLPLDAANTLERHSGPKTPQEGLLPLDTSRLSLSQAPDVGVGAPSMPPPVTPTTARDFRSSSSIFVTPANGRIGQYTDDATLSAMFDKVEKIGKGEFSTVFRVTTKIDQLSISHGIPDTPSGDMSSPARPQVFAVKKSKLPYLSRRDREDKLREVQALQALRGADHVVQYVDDWECNDHLYIETEFCEEGSLDHFLCSIGNDKRLDDFRIFKILQDICLGLKEMQDAGYMHLDLKPANIFITFEGDCKIGDFGHARPSSSAGKLDVEGDREYMARDLFQGNVGHAADIFSLGLIALEAAANASLPGNGDSWVALRSDNLSGVPSLTLDPSFERERDASGSLVRSCTSDPEVCRRTHTHDNLAGNFKRSELLRAPDFMTTAFHPSSLESIVRWTIAQEPEDRPTIDQLLDLESFQWVGERRNAPATVYEGDFGPADVFPLPVVVDDDTEMVDV